MQKSTEPSLTTPVASEAQCDPASTAHSENQTSTLQNAVPANFVEIYRILKPDSPDKEKETEDETNDKPRSPGEEQETAECSPFPSTITLAALKDAVQRRADSEVKELAQKWRQEFTEEKEAERLAQERAAEEDGATSDDSADQEDEEEFAEVEPSESEPDDQFGVRIGGSPAKTAGLEMKDLIRRDEVIEAVRYVSTEDSVINQFCERFDLPWNLRSLYESLILPTGIQQFGTTRGLFDDISALFHKYVMLPSKDCSLLAYWVIATWFTDYLPFLPSIVISGPPSIADLLLRTLVAVCRRPVLLAELSPAILRKLPINEITPTLLIREPQLNRYMSALLNASNQPGYLFFSGNTFHEIYCPKCIYVGECFKDSRATSNSVHINLGGSALTTRGALPAKNEITSFQNRLLSYRLLNHDKVAAASVRVSGFRPEVSLVAGVLAAAIVDDVELQTGIMDVLKDHDEQSRVDRASGVNGLVLRAVLFHCHQKDQTKFVREIAATANRFYAEDGESLKVSPETVGHVLKYLGLYSRRLGNAGRGLVFDKATQSYAHRVSHAYDVLTSEPSCEHCHELQQPQSEEVVQGV